MKNKSVKTKMTRRKKANPHVARVIENLIALADGFKAAPPEIQRATIESFSAEIKKVREKPVRNSMTLFLRTLQFLQTPTMPLGALKKVKKVKKVNL